MYQFLSIVSIEQNSISGKWYARILITSSPGGDQSVFLKFQTAPTQEEVTIAANNYCISLGG